MRRCRSYLFIKLMLFSWLSQNPGHIGMVEISKWHLFVVELETPLSSFLFWQGQLTPDVIINLVFEIYTKFPSIWYIELCVLTHECAWERSLSNVERSWQRVHDRWKEFIIIFYRLFYVYFRGGVGKTDHAGARDKFIVPSVFKGRGTKIVPVVMPIWVQHLYHVTLHSLIANVTKNITWNNAVL